MKTRLIDIWYGRTRDVHNISIETDAVPGLATIKRGRSCDTYKICKNGRSQQRNIDKCHGRISSVIRASPCEHVNLLQTV